LAAAGASASDTVIRITTGRSSRAAIRIDIGLPFNGIERPRCRRAAEKSDELASLHVPFKDALLGSST
jgi:hypothetical protein